MSRPMNTDKICALDELQQHIAHHYQWSTNLNRTLICGTPPKDDTMREDAHCRCRLGQWLKGRGKLYFEHHARFQNIVEHHKEMHDLARNLANTAMQGEQISETAYDEFQDAQGRLREEIETTYKDLHHQVVTTDPLTGAETRSTMHKRLDERISMVRNNQSEEWLIMMDLDHFKSINDSYGHATGDCVLTAVAASVRKQIRSNDLFFRYGGEEFLLCIGGIDQLKIQEITERIRHTIETTTVQACNGTRLSVTSSFGVTSIKPDLTVEETIDHADKALYEAKRAGRNRVQLSDDQNVPTKILAAS